MDRSMSGALIKLHTSMLGTFFVYTLYANFQEKIFADISRRKLQTLYSSNVTTIQSLQFSPRNICEDFFLKIGILCAKVYKKRSPT